MKYVTEGLAEALYQQRTTGIDESKDWSGFKVRYTYAGDSLSDYESTCIVKAKDEKEAIKIAMKKVNADSARNFRIDGIIGSYKQYKKDFPHSNFQVFEDTEVSEGKSYDFSNTGDKEDACAEYSKCMLNNLSSSAEKRMYELDKLAHDSGLKFIMTNYKQWSLPHAVVKPKYELVEEGVYDGVPTVAVPHEFSSQDWMNKKVKERIKIYLDYFEDAKKSGRKMKRDEISKNFNKLEKICLGIKDMDDYSKANQLLNIADTNGFVYKKYIDKLVNDLRTGKKFNLKGTPEVVESNIKEEYVCTVSESGKYANMKVPKSDITKMSGYYAKGSNPKALANTVKTLDKAISRYYISVSTGWKECEETFYKRCLELGMSEEDMKEIHDKAAKDTSIDIGQGSGNTSKKEESKKSEPAPRKKIEAKSSKGPTGVPFEDVDEALKVVDSGKVTVKKAFTVKEFDEDDGWVEIKIKPGTYKYQVIDFRGWKPRQLFVNGEWIDVAGDCVELEELLGNSSVNGSSRKVIEAFVDEAMFPASGKAVGYIGTVEITPKSGCKGIPKSAYKSIRNIIPPEVTWRDHPIGFDFKNGKLVVVYPVNTSLKVEYLGDGYDEMVSALKDAGWEVKE